MNHDAELSKEWASTAWRRRIRRDLPELRSPEIKRAIVVGLWIADYTDSGGDNAFPSRALLAGLTGFSQEYVTRAVRYLTACGLIARRRRPNASSVFTLLTPMGPIPWMEHLHILTTTRDHQRRAREKGVLFAAPDSERARVPDSERAPRSGQRARRSFQTPESTPGQRAGSPPEHERASVPDSERAGCLPMPFDAPAAHHQSTDHMTSGPSPQPQKRAREEDAVAATLAQWRPARAATAAETHSSGRLLTEGLDEQLPEQDGSAFREQIRAEREARGGAPATRTRWPRPTGDRAATA